MGYNLGTQRLVVCRLCCRLLRSNDSLGTTDLCQASQRLLATNIVYLCAKPLLLKSAISKKLRLNCLDLRESIGLECSGSRRLC